MKMSSVCVGLGLALLIGAAPATPAVARGILCKLRPGQETLPAQTLRGLARHLTQYPDISLASAAQRGAAAVLLALVRTSTRRWHAIGAASAAGFDTHRARRSAGDNFVGYLHAEHRRSSHDGRLLDPTRPEALIYANEPGRKPVLIGAMFSAPRGMLGPTPGGPIDRWHSHIVCVRGDKRGLAPLADGTCPKGSAKTQGSEMLHIWFTRDLRSAFAVHAPVPELCRDGLLSPTTCAKGAQTRGM